MVQDPLASTKFCCKPFCIARTIFLKFLRTQQIFLILDSLRYGVGCSFAASPWRGEIRCRFARS